jgi:hypothetical protein
MLVPYFNDTATNPDLALIAVLVRACLAASMQSKSMIKLETKNDPKAYCY